MPTEAAIDELGAMANTNDVGVGTDVEPCKKAENKCNERISNENDVGKDVAKACSTNMDLVWAVDGSLDGRS
jgi:hypothetical protein